MKTLPAIFGMSILVLLFLFVASKAFPFEMYPPPSFPWIFVANEYFAKEKITNRETIVNEPRNLVFKVEGKSYRFWLDTPFAIVLMIEGRTVALFSIHKIYGDQGLDYRYDRLNVVRKFPQWGAR